MNKLEATQEAAKWAAVLGPDWEPKVWDNLGWHWALQSKTMYLHLVHGGTWSVLANNEGRLPAGRPEWSARGNTPLEAILECHRKMQERIMEETEVWSQSNKTVKSTQLHMKGLEG